MSKQFDSAWLNARAARQIASKSQPGAIAEHFDGPESELHERITEDLRRRRWYFVRSRMDKRSTNQIGTPDFIVAGFKKESWYDLQGIQETTVPTTFWLEIKRKGSKLTKEQTITKHVLQALGHNYATCYSFEEYLKAIGE